jgi:alpha-1,3-mannosyltransferase
MPLDAGRPVPGMRVVHVVRQFAPAVGGLEEAVMNLALRQREDDGFDACIVTLDRVFTDRRRRLPPCDTVRGIPVRRLPWRGSQRYPLAPTVLRALAGADLVHVHGIDFFFDFLAATRALHRRRLVASTHGGFFHTAFASRLKQSWFETITRRSVRAYDAVIACSPSDAAMFERLDPPGFTIIENGIDLTKFRVRDGQQPDPRRLLTFGRFAHHKRIPLLFGLLSALLAKSPGWTLTIAGAAWDQDAAFLRESAASRGVSEAVRIVESPDDAALGSLIAQSSFFVCASAHEGFGLAAAEAASAGLIPVLSDIAPFARLVVRLKDGLAADLADPGAAADWIGQTASHPDMLVERRRRVAARASSYDWVHAAAAHAAVYARVLAPAVRAC